ATYPLAQLDPVHSRHDDVRHDQPDLLALRQDVERLDAIAGTEYAVTLAPEYPARQVTDRIIVLHHQQRGAARGRLGRSSGRGLHIDGARQIDVEDAALTGLAAHTDVAIALLHDAVYGCQAETGALVLRGEERLEQARECVGVHARARVGNAEQHVVAGRHRIGRARGIDQIARAS